MSDKVMIDREQLEAEYGAFVDWRIDNPHFRNDEALDRFERFFAALVIRPALAPAPAPAGAEVGVAARFADELAGALAGGSDYYLHRKTGGIYRVIGNEYLRRRSATVGDSLMPLYGTPYTWEAPFTVTDDCPEDTHVTYYINILTGERWARPSDMFYDGRFAQFDRPPTALLDHLAALGAPAGAG